MNLLGKLVDIIYPPQCPICREFLQENDLNRGDRGISFCRACYGDFRRIASPLCPICGSPFASEVKEDHLCEDCLRKRPPYEIARAPYIYNGAVLTAIHRFKYGSKSLLADPLGLLLTQYAENWVRKQDSVLIMPVPLHPRRLRERGFNQSLLLARPVAKKLHAELDFLSLRRVRYTSPQTGLRKEERRKNVRGAFGVETPEAVEGRTVLLIDDVATTGNTLSECASVLKRSGCDKVICLVLARTGSF